MYSNPAPKQSSDSKSSGLAQDDPSDAFTGTGFAVLVKLTDSIVKIPIKKIKNMTTGQEAMRFFC